MAFAQENESEIKSQVTLTAESVKVKAIEAIGSILSPDSAWAKTMVSKDCKKYCKKFKKIEGCGGKCCAQWRSGYNGDCIAAYSCPE